MAQAQTQQTCSYKGRTYRLLWRGKTKYGQRAKLEFLDGSASFWVPAEKIGTAAARQADTGETCAECGKPIHGKGRIVPDMSNIMAACCPRCASYGQFDRSYC